MSAAGVIAEALDSIPADPRPATLVNRDRAAAALASLKAAGYAVVELPKPLYGPDGAGGYGFPEDVSTCYGRVWEEDCDMDPDQAEALAAALLAAAAVSQ